MVVMDGDKIKVEYTGTLADGAVFDSTQSHGKPFEFEVGSASKLLKGFNNAVIGMEVGDEKEIELQPAEAYGKYDEKKIQKVPKENFKTSTEFKAGAMLLLGTPDGKKIPAKILDISDKEITVDFNHPLCDKVLKFKIKVVEII